MKSKYIYRLIVMITLSCTMISCSSINSIALSTVGEIIEEGSPEMETEGNWEMIRQSLPGSLKLVETFSYSRPNNLEFLFALTKGYTGLAFAVNETQFLADQLGEGVESQNKEQAIFNYTKSMRYGLKYLKNKGIDYSALLKKSKSLEDLKTLLDDKLDVQSKDGELVFYFAQAWGGLINLNKDDSFLVAQLPNVKSLFDWVCSVRPNINFGGCHIFYGYYELSRPKMFGGNPEKGVFHLSEVKKKFPTNLLGEVYYLQYYVVPRMDFKLYEAKKKELEEGFAHFEEKLRWSSKVDESSNSQSSQVKRVYIQNALAKKRFEIIKHFENEIF